MSDCSCLSQKIEFILYHDRKLKWHESIMMTMDPRRIKSTIVTIHGDTIDEINEKKEEFIKGFSEGHQNVKCLTFSE